MAHYFGEASYHTGSIGKWHLVSEEPVPKPQRGGYQYWLASNILEFASTPYDTIVSDDENKPVKLPGYRVDALTDAAIRYIDTHQDHPFYLFISFLEPHQQYGDTFVMIMQDYIRHQCSVQSDKWGLMVKSIPDEAITPFKTPETDRLVNAYLKTQAFEPAFAWEQPFDVTADMLIPWPTLADGLGPFNGCIYSCGDRFSE